MYGYQTNMLTPLLRREDGTRGYCVDEPFTAVFRWYRAPNR
jgi:hypothetical protein